MAPRLSFALNEVRFLETVGNRYVGVLIRHISFLHEVSYFIRRRESRISLRIYIVDLFPDIACPDGRERAGKPLINLNKATI